MYAYIYIYIHIENIDSWTDGQDEVIDDLDWAAEGKLLQSVEEALVEPKRGVVNL